MTILLLNIFLSKRFSGSYLTGTGSNPALAGHFTSLPYPSFARLLRLLSLARKEQLQLPLLLCALLHPQKEEQLACFLSFEAEVGQVSSARTHCSGLKRVASVPSRGMGAFTKGRTNYSGSYLAKQRQTLAALATKDKEVWYACYFHLKDLARAGLKLLPGAAYMVNCNCINSIHGK